MYQYFCKRPFILLLLVSLSMPIPSYSEDGADDDFIETESEEVKETPACPEGKTYHSCEGIEGKKHDFLCLKKKKLRPKHLAKKCKKSKKDKKKSKKK